MSKHKEKVTFYMKSGNVIVNYYTGFEISKLTGSKGDRKMEYTSSKALMTIDIAQIECCLIE